MDTNPEDGLENEQTIAEAAHSLLEVAGCTGIRITGAGENWQVAAFLASSDGVQHEAVAFSARNPNTPNDPVYLAGALLATLQRNAAAHERGMGLLAAEAEAGQDSEDASLHLHDGSPAELGPDAPEDEGGVAAEQHEAMAGEPDVLLGGDTGSDVVDADFTDGSFLIENRPDDIEVKEPEATDPGGVAYFGDNIHTIKLAKMGRLSQIARAAKDVLQEGWTLAEFASLQNLVVRIDRGEAPDDPEARARFMAISERSAAMARVDAYREQRELELEASDRAGIEAFDPEYGWP